MILILMKKCKSFRILLRVATDLDVSPLRHDAGLYLGPAHELVVLPAQHTPYTTQHTITSHS